MTAYTSGNLAAAARHYQVARNNLQQARTHVLEAALDALANGASEVKVAKTIGVDRNTIRRWQGK